MNPPISRQARGRLWLLVGFVTLIELGLLGFQWYQKHHGYSPNSAQLVSAADVDSARAALPATAEFLPTGVFVQSLQFESASDVHVTGWLWQAGPLQQRGVVLPEAVRTAGDLPPDLEYTPAEGDPAPDSSVATSSYFEASLRQSFNYRDYPLDHKTVWLRMWSSSSDAVLLPNLDSYVSTDSAVAFGLDPAIVVDGWTIEETFFDFKCPGEDQGVELGSFSCPRYDTNFGEAEPPTWQGYPELYFNVVIRRRILNAFITHLLPLTVVASLLFAMMLTVTSDRERADVAGFNTTALIAGASGLFFVTLLDHVQLRNQVAGDSIVYLETFHFLIYLAIVAVTANTFWFTSGAGWRPKWLVWEDNLAMKLAYWPVLLLVINAVTMLMLTS